MNPKALPGALRSAARRVPCAVACVVVLGLAASRAAPAAEQTTVAANRPMLSQPGTVTQAEALLSRARASAGSVAIQDMHGFGPQWGGKAQLFWRAPAPVDKPIRNWPSLTLPLEVTQAGTYEVTLFLTGAPDYGRVRVFLRGEAVGDYAGYAPGVSLRSFDVGPQKLDAGPNQLVLVVFGKEDASSNYFVGVDRLSVRLVTAK